MSNVVFVKAFNSTAGAGISLGMIISTMVYQYNRHIWYLDASVALCIAVGLCAYGIRLVQILLASSLFDLICIAASYNGLKKLMLHRRSIRDK